MYRSLGVITNVAAGTIIRATSSQSDPTVRVAAHSVKFQQHVTNTGRIYIGPSTLVVSTETDILAVIPANAPGILPEYEFILHDVPIGFNAADFYIDVEVSGEKCYVSYSGR